MAWEQAWEQATHGVMSDIQLNPFLCYDSSQRPISWGISIDTLTCRWSRFRGGPSQGKGVQRPSYHLFGHPITVRGYGVRGDRGTGVHSTGATGGTRVRA
jgi:hypothetical protein